MNATRALAEAWQAARQIKNPEMFTFPSILWDELKARGFDIVAMPSVEDHTAGFGSVEVSDKPTYDELIAVLDLLSKASSDMWARRKAADILERIK